ncbi:SPOR domain-containing protein [Cellulosimicrobium cellulans]|uniref:SPOR domain-containing protein n=1 Tax=Cellulosimicrobium cellulans TaxID=1710 RepID=UPI0019640486|nr:SPOR domain-containing protein [Cellulosimicrobium cellulans]MBN0042364.1 SPOR domain-containing protein [Cellulosimicrobium cellulans]
MSTGSRFTDDGEPAAEDEYYFDTRTGEVHRGPSGSWSHRMGPYPTREAAQKALETARERSDAWDEEDHRERGE